MSLTAENIAQYDCVVLTTAHQAFDYSMIAANAKLIVDTRGVFKAYKQDNIVSA